MAASRWASTRRPGPTTCKSRPHRCVRGQHRCVLTRAAAEYALDHGSYFVYFGSRTSQPARARAFIDLAVDRLVDKPQDVLAPRELAAGG